MVLSAVQKRTIIEKYAANNSSRTIAAEMNINRKTVLKWVNQFYTNMTLTRKYGSGIRKRINNQ